MHKLLLYLGHSLLFIFLCSATCNPRKNDGPSSSTQVALATDVFKSTERLPLHIEGTISTHNDSVSYIELKGWLRQVSSGCNSGDPDWHWQLIPDFD